MKAIMEKVDWKKEKATIIARYSAGESLRSIAKTYGVSFPTINKWLSRWEVTRRGGKARQKKLVKDLTGKRFGHLVVKSQNLIKYPLHWWCRCDCGKLVSVKADRLGRNKTCGDPGCGYAKRRNK